ncbi:Lipase (class 3) [Novymonas esmeraldas]|uniref:Lipase (Class 3) n=1 Tax=Novymonas esmeraldas TaxID=1808958 RepID=A0AAW0EY65_9TRYP
MKKFFKKHISGASSPSTTTTTTNTTTTTARRRSDGADATTGAKAPTVVSARSEAGADSSSDGGSICFNEVVDVTTTTAHGESSSMASESTTLTHAAATARRGSSTATGRYGSCYEGGKDGRCVTCGLVKVACNCQRCHCCNKFLLSLSNRRHCRRCWRATCTECCSHERTHDFLGGRVTRTCTRCAVPSTLLFVSQLRYSCFDTVAAVEASSKGTKRKDKTLVVQPATVNTPPPIAMEPHAFRWGLYVLGCALEAPRRCIRPTCTVPLSYSATCSQCSMPTVSLALHEPRHVTVPTTTTMTKGAGARHVGGDSSAAHTTADAVEDAVRANEDAAAAARTSAEVNEMFSAALPSGAEAFLFASLIGDTRASRKVLLALVACGIAGESSAMPSISLAMTSHPVYARLLRPTQTTELFTVYSAPGRVQFIAFNSGAARRPAVHQVLSVRMATRELWSSHSMKKSGALGKIVVSAEAASEEGLGSKVAAWDVREGLLEFTKEDNMMQRVQDIVLRIVKSGDEVVLCGHGIGGAVASWLTTCLLLESPPATRDALLCVTYGAPLIGSRALSDFLSKSGLTRHYQHFVHSSDMVPRLGYVDALLTSGNTTSCVSIVGHRNTKASATEVRECVVVWTASHEEPEDATASSAAVANGAVAAGEEGDGFSLTGFARKMRQRSRAMANESKFTPSKGAARRAASPADAAVRVNATAHGDLFECSREPFDNNVVRLQDEHEGEEGAAAVVTNARDADFERFSSPQHRQRQRLDPFGFFHFLWHPRGRYLCTDDPATAIALLSDRTDMRIELRDHLLSSYRRGMTEYIHSASAE